MSRFVLPVEFQIQMGAVLKEHDGVGFEGEEIGVFRLTGAEFTEAGGWEERRIKVSVVDEDSRALNGIRVAFAFSTGPKLVVVTEDYQWRPPFEPRRAFFGFTGGDGETDMILGPEGVVQEGEVGGVTVFINEKVYGSDVVSGLGMLPNHSGVHLTFQLCRPGVKPMREVVEEMQGRIVALEERLAELEYKGVTGV